MSMIIQSKMYYPQHVFTPNHQSLSAAKTGGGSPTYAIVITNGAGSTGVNAWRFSATVVNQLWVQFHVPTSYKLDSDMTPHLHWMPVDGNAGDIRLQLEVTGANVGSVFPNTVLLHKTETVPGTAIQHSDLNFNTLTGTGFEFGRTMLARIARLGNDGADTYAGTIYLLGIGPITELDSAGSDGTSDSSKGVQ